ncbi:hypothetical protein LguiA_035391 [Lonicera macranthoides]
MASLPPPTIFKYSSTLSSLTLSTKPHNFITIPKHPNKISCRASNADQNHSPKKEEKIDRRNVLIGLGGLYGATNLSDPLALSALVVPDTNCGAATLPAGAMPIDCCPPMATVLPFEPPSSFDPMRVKQAAHLSSDEYIAKYEKAIRLMKALPADDPRNFTQQVNIHCAYCDSSYEQVGFPNVKLDVHFSWLFFPFHRIYLYYYEKILGKLIDDPTFALPFWNWDSPQRMPIPSIGTGTTVSDKILVANNLKVMYRQMVSGAKTAQLFFGTAYRAGDALDPGAGSIENIPHTQVHIWTGDRTQPNGEDMGRFYSAAWDPIFFSHHANVDRMWTIWKTLGGNRKDFTDPDWLNSSFFFYDENAQLRSIKVQDCLENTKLKYIYQDVEIPWLKTKPTPRKTKGSNKTYKAGVTNAVEMITTFPQALDRAVSLTIKRPRRSRSSKEKEDEEEILVIDGIEFEKNVFVKFDVFVNEEDEAKSGADKTELAGSFANLPHKDKDGMKIKTCLRLGISELLEDLGADDDDSVLVTLVPRAGVGLVTIGDKWGLINKGREGNGETSYSWITECSWID